ncbi:MAG TPA: trehalase-like domain-containing protein, partial [Polyangiales bacterium]|nr:trehalase-like domain-containing protein [Polyangiales bacterium]
ALLDDEHGRHWELAPEAHADETTRRKQMYVADTNVLYTRFNTDQGRSKQVDVMAVEDAPQRVVRVVDGIRGTVAYRMRCAPRFDYARAKHRVEARGRNEVIFIPEQGTPLRLRASVPLEIVGSDVQASFKVSAGESASFVLEEDGDERSDELGGQRTIEQAVAYWRRLLARSTYRGRWREMVHRSTLLLKLLTCNEHGPIIAAPTFGLPEVDGGAIATGTTATPGSVTRASRSTR